MRACIIFTRKVDKLIDQVITSLHTQLSQQPRRSMETEANPQPEPEMLLDVEQQEDEQQPQEDEEQHQEEEMLDIGILQCGGNYACEAAIGN